MSAVYGFSYKHDGTETMDGHEFTKWTPFVDFGRIKEVNPCGIPSDAVARKLDAIGRSYIASNIGSAQIHGTGLVYGNTQAKAVIFYTQQDSLYKFEVSIWWV